MTFLSAAIIVPVFTIMVGGIFTKVETSIKDFTKPAITQAVE